MLMQVQLETVNLCLCVRKMLYLLCFRSLNICFWADDHHHHLSHQKNQSPSDSSHGLVHCTLIPDCSNMTDLDSLHVDTIRTLLRNTDHQIEVKMVGWLGRLGHLVTQISHSNCSSSSVTVIFFSNSRIVIL